MSLTDLQIRFGNEIGVPFDLLLRRLAAQPLALDARTNQILHSFEGLLLAVNHWPALHLGDVEVPQFLRDAANSIKHIRREKFTVINREFCNVFEHRAGQFRFLRNTIIGIDAATGEKGDLVLSLQKFVNVLSSRDEIAWREQIVYESVYGFFDWAFSINDTSLALSTAQTRALFVEKVGEGYEPRDIANIKYTVFGMDMLGIDPSFAFPK